MIVCSPSCGAAPESSSGGERYEADLLGGLIDADDEPHILLARHQRVPAALLGHVERVAWGQGLRWWVMPWVMSRAIGACWDRHGFDLLRVHSPLFLGPAAVIARRRYGITAPLVVHCHHWEPRRGTAALERWVLRQADRIIVDSAFVQRQLVGQGIDAGEIAVVYCGAEAPPAVSTGVMDTLGLRDKKIVLSIGPLILRKNPLEMLTIFRRVAEDIHDAVLVWVGDGPLRAKCQAKADYLGFGHRVRFPGYLSEASKAELLHNADVFAFTSELEGCPLAVLEAMAAGVPVVAWDAASLPELVVEGETGYLCTTMSRFIGCLEHLLETPKDRERMGTAAATLAAGRFRPDLTMAGVRAVYEEARR